MVRLCYYFVVAKRSPILGYNHNMEHRGLVFHIQTEDSGIDNPHLFTHLFHKGVILNSKKLDYDSESPADIVKSLMQAQHKSVLKELKAGDYDSVIDEFLGSHPDLRPSQDPVFEEADVAAAFARLEAPEASATKRVESEEPVLVHSPAPKSAPTPPGVRGKGRSRFARRTSQPPPFRDGAETAGVIVSRPAVIVGSPRKTSRTSTDNEVGQRRVPTDESLFGEEVISENSLDDVILAYLKEDSNDK